MLRTGIPYEDITKETGIKKQTLSDYAKEIKTGQNRTEPDARDLPVTAQARQERFDLALNKLLFTGLDMLQSWAELSGDKTFIRENPTGARDLGSTVMDRLDRIMAVVESKDPAENDD